MCVGGYVCVCVCVYEPLDYFIGCRKQLYLEIFFLRKKNIRLYERHVFVYVSAEKKTEKIIGYKILKGIISDSWDFYYLRSVHVF